MNGTDIKRNIMICRTMWTWESWCSHCAISPRLAGLPSQWLKPEISKPWTSLEPQVGADRQCSISAVRSNVHIRCWTATLLFCWMAPYINTFWHHCWKYHVTWLQIHTWKCPWCVKAGGWRKGRRQQSVTLWILCTMKPLCLMFLLRTLTRSACS